MLRLNNLTKSYKNIKVVNGVSLEVGREIRVILGLNGSGKTTMLKIAAGILPADSGEIYIDDRNITALNPEDREVGYVPQHPALFNNLNVRENIEYCLRNSRGSIETVRKFIEMLDLRDVLLKKPSTLSGGFKSRVSLVRALASQPKVMLLDEPLSDIDVAIKEKLLPQFKEVLRVLDIPVLYVTHDPWEASMLGDRFSVMVKGRLSDISSADEAFDVIKASYRYGQSRLEAASSA